MNMTRGRDRWDVTPLTWWPVRIFGSDRRTANVVCNNGHAGIIDEHVIAADGEVTPSVVCTVAGCGFHEFIRLVGWEA